MSRRTLASWLVLESCCVACCMRRPNCALSRSSSSFFSSSPFLARNSLVVMCSPQHPMDRRGPERQLRRRERECLARERLVDPVHLENDLARLDLAHEILRIALAVAHAHLGGLARNRLVGEHADPDAPAALDVARERAARSLELARGKPPAGERLQAVLAERDARAARGDALVASLLLFPVLGSGRLQHALFLFLAFVLDDLLFRLDGGLGRRRVLPRRLFLGGRRGLLPRGRALARGG